MKKKHKSLVNIISLLLVGLFLFALVFEMPVLALFCLNAFALILTLCLAKWSIFSYKNLVVFYVLVPLFFKYLFDKSSGALAFSNLSLEVQTINVIIFTYLLIDCLLINNTKILLKEKAIFEKMLKMDGLFLKLFSLLAIFCIIAYYPPSFLNPSGARFYHLLPGNFWNHVSVICLLFTLPYIRFKKITPYLPWAFVIIWCLIKHERVDAIGLSFLLILWHIKQKLISRPVMIGLMVLLIVFLAIMGSTRIGIRINDFGEFMYTIVVQSTSSDIAYILNTSIHYVNDYGLLLGKTYSYYIFQIIPFAGSTSSASQILNAIYVHPGGIHVLAEPYMNFGIIGIILYSIIEFVFINWLLSRKSNISCIYYFFIFVAMFRYCWYGIEYLETGLVFLIPISYVFYKSFIPKKRSKPQLCYC